MLMNWRRLPDSSKRRSRNPGYSASSFARTSATVAPSTLTSASPLVSRLSGPGTRPVTAIAARVYGSRLNADPDESDDCEFVDGHTSRVLPPLGPLPPGFSDSPPQIPRKCQYLFSVGHVCQI